MKNTETTKEFKSFNNELNSFVSKLTNRIETLIKERGINHLHLKSKHEILITEYAEDYIKSISVDGCEYDNGDGFPGNLTFEGLFMASP